MRDTLRRALHGHAVDRVRQVVRGPSKKRKKGVATAHVPPRQIALAIVFVCFIVALLWALFTGLAGTMDKSGAGYSDQLMKFQHSVNPQHSGE